jgi:hypothetical protein
MFRELFQQIFNRSHRPSTARKIVSLVVCTLIIVSGTAGAKSKTTKPKAKPAASAKSAWQPCTIRARLARFNSFKMRKIEWYVYEQVYLHFEQKAECSGSGPLPKRRNLGRPRVGGAVYVNGQMHYTNERGENLNASYDKYVSAAGDSTTNANLIADSVDLRLDDNSDGILAELSGDALLRGPAKSWGVLKQKTSTPDGGWETKDVGYSYDDASVLFTCLGCAPQPDKGGKGVDGVDLRFGFYPNPGKARDPERQAAADNVRQLLNLLGDGIAASRDHYGATTNIIESGYADVHLARQYFIVNNADAIQTVEAFFDGWIENDKNPAAPKDLPPLDRADPETPVQRPIISTPPPAT